MKSSRLKSLAPFGKLTTLLLVVYAAAFYALPQSSFIKQKAKKELADVGNELVAEIDVENELEPDEHHFTISNIQQAETAVRIASFVYLLSVKELTQQSQPKKYCLNCSFLFYG